MVDPRSGEPGTLAGLRPRAEGRTLLPPPDGEGYSIEPPEASHPQTHPPVVDTEAVRRQAEEKLRRESEQFSLSGLLLLVTLVSVLMGPIVWLPLPAFAGLVGLGSLVLLTLISIYNARQAVVRLAWLLLFGMYLAAAAAAYIYS
jgi:hypothetical protein